MLVARSILIGTERSRIGQHLPFRQFGAVLTTRRERRRAQADYFAAMTTGITAAAVDSFSSVAKTFSL